MSYGKDSLACLGAIEQLGLPLDRIVHAEVWATDTIQADLPPMVEFKAKADAIIKERWGFEVEHIRGKYTYEQHFYVPHIYKSASKLFSEKNGIYGFPIRSCAWCNSRLKVSALTKAQKGADYAFEKVTARLHPGAIILLHAVSSDNAGAMARIIDYAREQGYEFKSLDDLKL